MPSGVFAIIPDNFFSPLATPNRKHYAALLVLYYRLFQESTRGLERELVVREFMNYFALNRDILEEENDDNADNPVSAGDSPQLNAQTQIQELNFSGTERPEDTPKKAVGTDSSGERGLANHFLRRLINTGWLGEETLEDFSRVINITAWGKPFLEALVRVDEGLKTEYESHVVNVYSSLCGETVKENGHFMVLKAREETRALIDSLKVLSQSIKGYYDKLNAGAIRSKAASVLHEHYDLYAGEVLDKAYIRLKTSDNVSRYRQSIFRQVTELLHNDEWLETSAGKYMRILQKSREECREKLVLMLEEIRDDLKSVDPLEDEIDRRNADYSRYSTEIIRAYIEPDSTVAGKLGLLIKALHSGDDELRRRLAHGLHRIQFLSPSSLALRRPRDEGDFSNPPALADVEALDESEAEFLERMRRRLSLNKINTWLDEQGGKDRILIPAELIKGTDSYIRFVYSLLYGDSRNNFGYTIEESPSDENEQDAGTVSSAGYVVPDIRLRRKHESRS